jgi:hypothetical protein
MKTQKDMYDFYCYFQLGMSSKFLKPHEKEIKNTYGYLKYKIKCEFENIVEEIERIWKKKKLS